MPDSPNWVPQSRRAASPNTHQSDCAPTRASAPRQSPSRRRWQSADLAVGAARDEFAEARASFEKQWHTWELEIGIRNSEIENRKSKIRNWKLEIAGGKWQIYIVH